MKNERNTNVKRVIYVVMLLALCTIPKSGLAEPTELLQFDNGCLYHQINGEWHGFRTYSDHVDILESGITENVWRTLDINDISADVISVYWPSSINDVTGDGIEDVYLVCSLNSERPLYLGVLYDAINDNYYATLELSFNYPYLQVLDIDHDGRNEIILETYTRTYGHTTHLYSSDGIASPDQGVAPQVAMPGDVTFAPSYPNPTNAETIIRFELPNADDVNVRVYNTLGEEVVCQTHRLQAGSQQLALKLGALASGSYFYCIETSQGLSPAQRLTIVK